MCCQAQGTNLVYVCTVLLNLNLKPTCGKLVCIFHSSSSIFCKLANKPAHAQQFVVSILHAFRAQGMAQYQQLACSSILFTVWCWRHTQKGKPVRGVYLKPRSLRIKQSIITSQMVNS